MFVWAQKWLCDKNEKIPNFGTLTFSYVFSSRVEDVFQSFSYSYSEVVWLARFFY